MDVPLGIETRVSKQVSYLNFLALIGEFSLEELNIHSELPHSHGLF